MCAAHSVSFLSMRGCTKKKKRSFNLTIHKAFPFGIISSRWSDFEEKYKASRGFSKTFFPFFSFSQTPIFPSFHSVSGEKREFSGTSLQGLHNIHSLIYTVYNTRRGEQYKKNLSFFSSLSLLLLQLRTHRFLVFF